MFESVAFRTHPIDAAFDKHNLSEGKDGKGNMNEYAGGA